VNAALLGNNAVKAYDIKVSVRKGEVMLSGFVDDQTQIDQSIAITRAVEGVQNVTNEMMVKSGSRTIGNKVDDGVITAKLKSAILNDATINSLDISIVTSKGDVLLSGFVDSETQITRATELAGSVDGVTKVTNKMSLKR
jgi:hyperosmotically inducible protein